MELKDPPAAPRAPWFRREPINLGEVVVEGAAVLLGVLGALAIDDWRERHQDGRTLAAARVSIAAELRKNAQRLEDHAGKADRAAQAMARASGLQADDRACTGYPGWSGAQMPMLDDTAYQVAIATQAFAKMPYAQAGRIGEAYGHQRQLAEMHRKAGDMLLLPQAVPVRMCVGIQQEMARAGEQGAQRLNATADQLAPVPR